MATEQITTADYNWVEVQMTEGIGVPGTEDYEVRTERYEGPINDGKWEAK